MGILNSLREDGGCARTEMRAKIVCTRAPFGRSKPLPYHCYSLSSLLESSLAPLRYPEGA